MSTYRHMPALSADEIRKISENAVAKVAAQKIVTTKSAYATAMYTSKETNPIGSLAATSLAGKSESSLFKRAGSVLSQSNGRMSLQASFAKAVKNHK